MDDKSYRLDGQTGIVVGGAGGIGQAIAVGLGQAGSNVVIADLATKQADAEAVAAAVREAGCRALALPIDVTSVSSIEDVAQKVLAAFGAIDWMVDCAGVNVRKSVLDYTEREWDLMVDINLKGTFFCAQIVARQMVKQGRGRIVNIASQLATVAMPDGPSMRSPRLASLTWPRPLPSSWGRWVWPLTPSGQPLSQRL